MGQTWYATVWTVGAAVVFLGAMALLWWGLFGDRSRGRARCPKCWYEMRGSVAAGRLACPECGYEATRERQLRRNRRRWLPIVVGLVLLSPYGYAGWVIGGWWQEQRALAQFAPDGVRTWSTAVGPKWLTDLLPQRWTKRFRRVDAVSLRAPHDADVRRLRRFRHLEQLDLTGPEATDAQLRHVAPLGGVLRLYLTETSVTDDGLAPIAALSKLEQLVIVHADLSGSGLAHLKNMKSLKILTLVGVTDEALVHIAGMVGLEEIHLNSPSITDQGLAHLSNLMSLRSLNLECPAVTVAGLAPLKNLRNLKRLGIDAWTAPGSTTPRLRQMIPQAQVEVLN